MGLVGQKASVARLWAGFWTPKRQKVYPRIVAVMVLAWFFVYCAAGDGIHDFSGQVMGHDFITSYATSTLVRSGQAAKAYEPAFIYEAEDAIARTGNQSYWSYPPVFLFAIAPLSVFPYAAAFGIWQSLQLLLFGGALRALTKARSAVALAVGSPFALVNLGYGQNGLLSAGILGAGLSQLVARPVLAGGLLSLIIYKPQMGAVVPIFLVATRNWRALGSFISGSAVLCLASLVVFGPATWRAFIDSLHLPLEALEQGRLQVELMPTVEAAMLRMGAPVALGRGLQYATAICSLAVALFCWWRPGSPLLKAALIPPVTLLVTPYAYSYDLAILAVSAGLVAREAAVNGWCRGDKLAVGGLWMAPFLAVVAQLTAPGIPLLVGGVFGYLAIRAATGDSKPSRRTAVTPVRVDL